MNPEENIYDMISSHFPLLSIRKNIIFITVVGHFKWCFFCFPLVKSGMIYETHSSIMNEIQIFINNFKLKIIYKSLEVAVVVCIY